MIQHLPSGRELHAPFRARGASLRRALASAALYGILTLPGVAGAQAGVASPTEWAKDYVEDQFKDAVIGSEISEGMDAVIQQGIVRAFDAARDANRYKRCEGAAFNQADEAVSELRNARVLGGAARTLFAIEKNLLTLGTGTITEFLKSKGEDYVREKIRDFFKDQKAEVYENTYSRGGCTQAVRIVWDRANGRYLALFTGSCECKSVVDGFLTGRRVKLKDWMVRVEGTIQVVPKADKSGLTYAVGFGRITIAANCGCDPGSRTTWTPPPQVVTTPPTTTTTPGGVTTPGGPTRPGTPTGPTTPGPGGGAGTTPPGGGGVTPPPPPPPPPPVSTACPQCDGLRTALAEAERAKADAATALRTAQQALDDQRAAQRRLQSQIDRLKAQLKAQEGTGGEAFDPESGERVTATTGADGVVTVNRYDGAGNLVETFRRDRKDMGKVREELEAREGELARSREREAKLKGEADALAKAVSDLAAKIAGLRRQLEECLKRCIGTLQPQVQVVIGLGGNNPFNPHDPLDTGGETGGVTTPPPPPIVPDSPGSIRFSAPSFSGTEGGSVVVTVQRIGGVTGPVSVQHSASGATASSGSDFSGGNGSLSWPDGDQSTRSFTVNLPDDALVEGTETFNLNLSGPTGGATLANPSNATVSIQDNEAPVGPCGVAGNAWQNNTGNYSCSGSCQPSPTPQALSVSGNIVTLSPFHAGGAATFLGCSNTLNSQSTSLTYFGQSNHRAEISRFTNNSFGANITSAGGGTCFFSCSRVP